ncbi:hypothetical protein H6A19_12025 [Clostridium saudiense]|uniref:Uncharacterized protein n=3 Tax=Clostridium TaxID=1485 RepID=A0ABS2FHW1_9CLOT|nr:hypothetical protein [Clostridium saudiense]MBM6820054.1 hypothetical protein [Clostridium saudiense]
MRHSRSFKKNNIDVEDDNEKERYFELSEDDLRELSLLNNALISIYLFVISDIIFYDSTINAIGNIVNKNDNQRIIAEVEAIESGYLELISKLILINVDISRYNHLYKKFINGKKEDLLKPEIDITIGDGFQILTYFFIVIGFVGTYKVNKIKNISIDDSKELSLLLSQLDGINIRFYADYLAYISILESMQLVYNKYQKDKNIRVNPDIPAIQSAICYFLSRLILANVAFTRYDELYKKYGKTQYRDLLQPNLSINVGNVFGIIGCIYILLGFIERYERNINGPVFGI